MDNAQRSWSSSRGSTANVRTREIHSRDSSYIRAGSATVRAFTTFRVLSVCVSALPAVRMIEAHPGGCRRHEQRETA